MKCLYCKDNLIKKPNESVSYFSNKKYCSKPCASLARIGEKQSNLTKTKRSESLKRYYAKDEKRKTARVSMLHTKYTDKIRGTGWRFLRLKRIERQPYCGLCGITREQHFSKYSSDLQIHHKNRKGRNLGSKNKHNDDNSDSNLQVLCKSCHASISSNYRWRGVF